MRRYGGALLATIWLVAPAGAQTPGDPALRAEQAALYGAMLASPDDPALMFDYVRVSLALQDNEAVISTLERALIFRPDDGAVLLELGAAYFRLGSYSAARGYFERAGETATSEAARERIDLYLAAIDQRDRRSRFTGTVMVGGVWSSNANLGLADRTLRFGGTDVVVDDSVEAEPAGGLRASAQLTHLYDLGRANLDAWRTDVGAYALNYAGEDQGDVETVSIATGPTLALTDESFGATMRPFVGFRAARSAGAPFFVEYGGGVEGWRPIDPQLSLYGAAGAGWRDYAGERGEDLDGVAGRGLVGVAYAPRRGLSLFAGLVAETDRAAAEKDANVEAGARVSASWNYTPDFEGVTTLWRVSAYAEAAWRRHDGPDPIVDPDQTREDLDLRLGLAHLFRLGDGLGLQADIDFFRQNSNIANYDVENVTGGLSVVFEF